MLFTPDMEVYFIRHTTPLVDKGICYGHTDLELASTFQEEGKEVLRQLPQAFDAVYSSPLKRCHRLAEMLPGERLLVDDRLRELNFGAWEMKAWDSLPKQELADWMADYVQNAPPRGESMLALQERVMAWWKELQLAGFRQLAVVTHGGVIRIMNAYFNSIPLSDAFEKFQIAYGGIAVFKI